MRAHLVRAADDRLDVLDLRVLEEDVADRDEEGALVDRVDDRGVVRHRDDLEPRLRLVEVADRREVRLLVDDPGPLVRLGKAREDNGLGDGHVLVHDDRVDGRAEDPAELVADRPRHVPPALAPAANPALAPHPRVLPQIVLGRRGHGREGVVDEVRAGREDREAVAIVGRVDHVAEAIAASSAA